MDSSENYWAALPRITVLLLIALTAVSSNSCKNNATTSTNPVEDTIHLVSNTPVVPLQGAAAGCTADSIQIWLSCGCKFSLITLGSGEDASHFTVQSRTPDTAWTTPHYLRFQYQYQCALARDSAWFAFSALDHYGNTKYDTLRVMVSS
ncbi:MAG TPA: hypothetical protein VFH95_06345 [Candidatus Kapabacteria bacterium]|nr:hypothetical protein [Candidatus Kapabacteria bacterium]